MHIVLGGTGNVGSAVAETLLKMGERVTVVAHSAGKVDEWLAKGAEVVVADVNDRESLSKVLELGKRLFLLNPPADPASNTDREERKTLTSIISAINGSGIEKIVAASTYGAQPAKDAGDLGVLFEMEQALFSQSKPAVIQRGAYYMSNWDMGLETAKSDGLIQSFFPADFLLPMVAPSDLGKNAARLMVEPAEGTSTIHFEGPERYTPADVAKAFSNALERDVEVQVIPRENWVDTFKAIGFSDAAAASYANMTEATVDGVELPTDPVRGTTTLQEYISGLVYGRSSSLTSASSA